MNRILLLYPAMLLFALGCATAGSTGSAATTWGYSHWFDSSGAGSMGSFEKAKQTCLEKVGVAGDPTAVESGSSEEDAYIECMNDLQWCTQEWRCHKA